MSNVSSRPIAVVIDDEVEIRRFLNISLEASGYVVHEAATGMDGLARIAIVRPDIVILDIGLPDMDGFEVLKRLREWSQVPVIALSARHAELDKIAMLDTGAQDYLTKPFGVGELLARIRVARRSNHESANAAFFRIRDLHINFESRAVTIRDTPVKLTKTEYALLKLLAVNIGKVLTHKQLLRTCWGPEYEAETHYLRVYIGMLRKKIEADPDTPTYIVTESGIGYRLRE